MFCVFGFVFFVLSFCFVSFIELGDLFLELSLQLDF